MELNDALAHAIALEEVLTSFERLAARRTTTASHDRGLGSAVPFQLQELEERLSRLLLQSRNLFNTFSSKDGALPDDVLYLILEQACVIPAEPPPSLWAYSPLFHGSSLFSASTARKLSGVCGRWRSLLLSNSTVWSDAHMTIRKPENILWLDACLARSASSPVKCIIQIDRPLGSYTNEGDLTVTEVISRNPSNIRSLAINPRASEEYDVLASDMGNLERLQVNDGTYGRPAFPPTSHLAKLGTLILNRLYTLPHDVFFNITDLTLSNVVSPVANLVDVLQTNQALEAIRITNTVVMADPRGRFVSLPHLNLLCISQSTPVPVLHIVLPLPTPSRVIIHDGIDSFIAPGIRNLFNPFVVFGPNDSAHTALVSFQPTEALITYRTFAGATIEIIVQPNSPGHLPEFTPLLRALTLWGPFPDLRSLHLHIETAATGPITTTLIQIILFGVPRVTRLTFEGKSLSLYIFRALNASARVCPELEYLGGTLYPEDPVTDCLRLLSEAADGRPTIREVVLEALLLREEAEGILADTSPLIEQIKSRGMYNFSFTPLTK